jgi:hypothetical protein
MSAFANPTMSLTVLAQHLSGITDTRQAAKITYPLLDKWKTEEKSNEITAIPEPALSGLMSCAQLSVDGTHTEAECLRCIDAPVRGARAAAHDGSG